ncbi:hypothetical protein LguiA_000899 [Lonicera macranthoides]
MEVSGVVLRPIPCFSGAGIDAHSHHSSLKFFPARVSVSAGYRFSGQIRQLYCRELRMSVKPRNINEQLGPGFCDMVHEQYYSASRPTIRCGGGKKEKEMKMKKKVKLLKGLSKNLSNLPAIGFGLDPDHDLADQVKGKISEAAELLLKELQQLRAKEKELKRQRKEEKAKLKATRMQNKINREESLDSSSESSDSECGEVVDMSHLKIKVPSNPTTIELQPPLIRESTLTPPTPPSQPPLTQQERLTPTSTPVQGVTLIKESGSGFCSGSCNNAGNSNSKSSVPNGASTRKIEVCMGGKCKKSGAASLLENFERVVGSEGSVVGCKCMGKCRDGPNVRVLNHVDGVEADEYVRKPYDSLCIGVGLEDVSSIVANFLGGNQKDLGLATAS